MIHTADFLRRKWALVLVMFFFSANVIGQNLINHIPQEALFVAQMHLDRLDAKSELDSIGSMPFLKDLTRRAPELIKNPAAFGVNTRKKMALFYGAGDEVNYFAFMLPLKDMEKLKGITGATSGSWTVEPTNNFFTLKETKTSYGEERTKVIGAFNESFLLMFNDLPTPNLDPYDPDLSWEERQEKRKNAEKMKQVSIQNKIKEIMELSGVNSINNQPGFKEGFPTKGDITLWANSNIGYGSYEKLFRKQPALQGFYNQLQSITKGGYNAGTISMNDGQIYLDVQTKTNPELEEIVSEATKAKINKRFANYVKQDDLMGYVSFALNTYNVGKSYRKLFTPLLDSIPNVPPGLGTSMYDVLDIFIDEDAIADLIPGNAMLAFTGLKTFEKEYTTYQYNDSTFEREEIVKTKEDMFPEFTFMLSTDSEEDMQKILKAFSKIPLGRRKGNLLTNQGFYYNIPEAKKNLGVDFYLALQNGILFISNNTDLIQNHLTTGYDKDVRMTKAHRKALKKSNQVVYMNFGNLFEQLKQMPGRTFQGEQPQKALGILASNMDEMWSRSYRRKDPTRAFVTINMKNKEENSLSQLASMINEVFLATSKRAGSTENDGAIEELNDPPVIEMDKD